jgi:hypothetical protein
MIMGPANGRFATFRPPHAKHWYGWENLTGPCEPRSRANPKSGVDVDQRGRRDEEAS